VRLGDENHRQLGTLGDQIWRQTLIWGTPSPEALGPKLTKLQ